MYTNTYVYNFIAIFYSQAGWKIYHNKVKKTVDITEFFLAIFLPNNQPSKHNRAVQP